MQLEDNHIVLTWQKIAPKYRTDLDVSILEEYKSLPEPRHVDIWLPMTKGSLRADMVVTFQCCDSLLLFNQLRVAYSANQKSRSLASHQWAYESELTLSLIVVFEVMILEITRFLQECSVELEKMLRRNIVSDGLVRICPNTLTKIKNAMARRDPTSTKVRYLMHLEDCRGAAYHELLHSVQVLSRIKTWTEATAVGKALWDAGMPFSTRLMVIHDDLEFFRKHIADMAVEIQYIRRTVGEHLNVEHDRRNFLLTILAAVYLPLSFATSFFGMNINSIASPSEEGFSNYTAAWIANLPMDMQNTTKALVSTIATSGTLTYDWKTFGITAACLLLTLPITLTVGTLLRFIRRKTAQYVTYWRIISVPFGIFVFACSTDYLYYLRGFSDDDKLVRHIPFFLSNGILLSAIAFKIHLAWKTRGRITFWAFSFIICSLCIISSVAISYRDRWRSDSVPMGFFWGLLLFDQLHTLGLCSRLYGLVTHVRLRNLLRLWN